jgi:hypothetical protein
MRIAAVIFCFIALSAAAFGACHVITPAGAGSHSGADWNNACTGLTGACDPSSGMVRGDSYYVAKGSYTAPSGGGLTSWNLGQSTSGSLDISIKAVTASDHCTDTGYVAGTHFGQAVMSGEWFISTSHWIVDGQYGTGRNKGSYGIKCLLPSGFKTNGMNGGCFYDNSNSTNITMRYIEMQGTNNSPVGICESAMWFDVGSTNILAQHIYNYNANSMMKVNFSTNVTLENSIVDSNYEDATNCHGEPIAVNGTSNFIVRNNQFLNCVGTGCISTPCGFCGTTSAEYYGNVFATTDGVTGIISDGIMAATGAGAGYSSLKFYNNTIANWTAAQFRIASTIFYNSSATWNNLDAQNNQPRFRSVPRCP